MQEARRPKFKLNQVVNVCCDIGWGRARKFRGTVERVHNDQHSVPTYDVQFDHGDYRMHIGEPFVTVASNCNTPTVSLFSM